jgi:hypothetical protein
MFFVAIYSQLLEEGLLAHVRLLTEVGGHCQATFSTLLPLFLGLFKIILSFV